MANLSYLTIGIPAQSRLVFRNIHDQVTPPTPPPASADVIRNFSLREWRKWHRPEDERELRRLGITPKAAEVIADVAARQAAESAAARLDEQQRMEELRGEMRLRGLEMQGQHLLALNDERERLINDEISARLQLMLDNENALILLILSSM